MATRRKRDKTPALDGIRNASSASIIKAVLYGLVTLAAAWLVFSFSAANALVRYDPDWALKFWPDHGPALARKSDIDLSRVRSPKAAKLVLETSREALRHDPIDGRAMRVFAYANEVAGNRDIASAAMVMTETITRREFGAHIWLIEDAVRRNDIDDALRHYDIAMTTNIKGRSVLFPVLSQAIGDPDIAKAMGPIVRSDPVWLPQFLQSALDGSVPSDSIARVVVAAKGLPDGEEFRSIESQLLMRLFAEKKYSLLRPVVQTIDRLPKQTYTSIAFSPHNTDSRFAPVTWQFFADNEAGGQLRSLDGASQLLVYASATGGGMAAQKTLFLTPGRYRISFRQVHDPEYGALDDGASLLWQVRCATDDRELWRGGELPTLGQKVAADFTVPADCAVQRVAITVRPGLGGEGIGVNIADPRLTKLP